MATVDNPPNPFARTICEPVGPPPVAVRTVREESALTILTRNNSPDIPYRWSVNPYRGCAHGCAYCYARRTHEYLDHGAGTDFERQLHVKLNAPELLAAALSRPRWAGEQIAFSGVTDCYQPLEAEYRLTRRCLEVCRAQRNPVGIVTKSTLVLRDVDLLQDLARLGSGPVYFSICFADDDTARKVEPSAPPPSARWTALKRLREAGIPAGLLISPVIPGLNDRDIPKLLGRAAECGATRAWYSPVRLPGSVAAVFLTRLRRVLPEAAKRVEDRIRDVHGGRLNDPRFGHRMQGHGPYWESVQRLFETVATRLGLAGRQSWCRGDSPPAGRQLQLFGPDGMPP